MFVLIKKILAYTQCSINFIVICLAVRREFWLFHFCTSCLLLVQRNWFFCDSSSFVLS